jgi:CRISPR-associated protein Cas1
MPPLFVVEQGSKLVIRKRRLEVHKGQQVLASLPLVHLSQVVLFGNIGLTTPAISLLLGRGIPVIFLSQRGEYKGRLVGPTTPHTALRRRQYRLSSQLEFALPMAQAMVAAKIRHMRACLRRWRRRAGERARWEGELDVLEKILRRIPRTTALSSLGGLEGSATAAYFSALRSQFPGSWRFMRRARRPPPDPVNAMLSFGYTLLASAALGAVEAAGLDPYVGFLHRPVYNRAALALDIMEEFRPLVDAVVLGCCRRGIVKVEDFRAGEDRRPVLMGEEAKRRFIAAYEARMGQRMLHPVRGERLDVRRCLLEQARQVARAIQGGRPQFRGMGFR